MRRAFCCFLHRAPHTDEDNKKERAEHQIRRIQKAYTIRISFHKLIAKSRIAIQKKKRGKCEGFGRNAKEKDKTIEKRKWLEQHEFSYLLK